MSRLVIVSNRVPTPKEREQRAGGLAIALMEALKSETLWFGWSGKIGPPGEEARTVQASRKLALSTIDISEEEYRRFYVGFANSTLWPLLHFRLGLMEYRREDFQVYGAVNQRFVRALLPLLKPDDLIWVHDYHLIPAGSALRARGQKQKLGFFLHIPFPPPNVFDVLPCAKEMLISLCDYDLLGFQTDSDRLNFLACCTNMLNAQVSGAGGIEISGRSVATLTAPAGIDADLFEKEAAKAVSSTDTVRLKESLVGRKLIIGVDRLDYSKGLSNRFEAYSRLLERFPHHRQRVSYLQVAVRSREDVVEYQSLKRDLDRICGKVNGRFAEFDWVPLRYLTRSLPRKMLAGFYRTAEVGLVTPLRDGMNLVAKEYVAAQDDTGPGVLILSRFAGAAEGLSEALIVNPFDADEIAEALDLALTMELPERQWRSKALKAKVRVHSSAAWCRDFLERLRHC